MNSNPFGVGGLTTSRYGHNKENNGSAINNIKTTNSKTDQIMSIK